MKLTYTSFLLILVVLSLFVISCSKEKIVANPDVATVSGADLTLKCLNLSFVQQGNKLVGTGAVGSTGQGLAVSLSGDGNTAIVGGANDNVGIGATWVFTRQNGVWHPQGNKLVGTGATGNAWQHCAVSISGDGNTAIVGGNTDNSNAGAAWIFTRHNGVWCQQGNKLVGKGAVGGAGQGYAVSISGDGNTAIVGGYTDNGGLGASWIFTRKNGEWRQQGNKLVGKGCIGNAEQGVGVSLSGDGNTAIIGGYMDDGGIGASWVFERTKGMWRQQGSKIVGAAAVGSAGQGYAVSISGDGNTAIVGGYTDNGGLGASWIFTRRNEVWRQQGAKLVGSDFMQITYCVQQGVSVSLSSNGNTAIVGGFGDNVAIGASWIFTRQNGEWHQLGNKLVGTGAIGNAWQGYAVSISGDGNSAIVGGPNDNGGIGGTWIFNR